MAKLSEIEISVNQRVMEVFETFRRRDASYTIAEFCAQTGMDASNWSKYKDSKHIFADQLVNLTKRFGLNGDWLLTGEGRMFKDLAPPEEATYKVTGYINEELGIKLAERLRELQYQLDAFRMEILPHRLPGLDQELPDKPENNNPQ